MGEQVTEEVLRYDPPVQRTAARLEASIAFAALAGRVVRRNASTIRGPLRLPLAAA